MKTQIIQRKLYLTLRVSISHKVY